MSNYEVFISFKNTDAFGQETPDAKMAKELYDILTARNISTFFSPVSIQKTGKAQFAQAIDEALEQCNILVAVGTKTEYLESNWVFDEIDTFRNEMLNGNKPRHKSALISYVSSNLLCKDLPIVLRKCESFYDVDKLVNFIITKQQQADHFINENAKSTPPVVIPVNSPHTGVLTDSGTTSPEDNLLIGRFQLLYEIGHGGTSTVYIAHDRRAKRTVAVKMFSQTQHPLLKKAFLEEATHLKNLSHPSIPAIYDIVETPDTIYVVMDYIDGQSLQKHLDEHGPLPEASVLDIAHQLCDVFDYLHSQTNPIIYRDLKPANIILQEDSKIKLIDFGTAREYKEENLCDTVLLGTVGYAAPEQYGGFGQTDTRTDIYCFGITLHTLLTGMNPSNPSYVYLPVRKYNANISMGLEYIINKCVERDPDNRFQTIQEVRDAFDHIEKLSKKSKRAALIKNFFSWNRPSKKHTPNTAAPLKSSMTPPVTVPPVPITAPPITVPPAPIMAPTPLAQAEYADAIQPTTLLTEPSICRTPSYRNVETLTLKTKGLKILLSELLFGQENAVDQFISGYFQSQMLAEFEKSTSPYATYLFMGPSGVGKTFFAKNIAHTFKYPYKHFTEENFDTLPDDLYSFLEASPKCLLIFEGMEHAMYDTIQFLAKLLTDGKVHKENQKSLSLDKTIIIFASHIDKPTVFPESLYTQIPKGNIISFDGLSSRALCNIGKRALLSGARDFERKLNIPLEIDERFFPTLLYHQKETPSAQSIKQAAGSFYTCEIFEALRFGILNSLEDGTSVLSKIRVCVDFSDSADDIQAIFEETNMDQSLCDLHQAGRYLTFSTTQHFLNDAKIAEIKLTNFKLTQYERA